ncbi:MAG: Scr1 family TA system antitoxin-like transcriptional regulator [Candidatus Saccharimonadales bacterium]
MSNAEAQIGTPWYKAYAGERGLELTPEMEEHLAKERKPGTVLETLNFKIISGHHQTQELAYYINRQLDGRTPEESAAWAASRRERREHAQYRINSLIGERALRYAAGVDPDQLTYLLARSEEDGVEIRVLEEGAVHPIEEFDFHLLKSPGEPDTVYEQGVEGNRIYRNPKRVNKFQTHFAKVSALALDVEASRAYMDRIKKSR